MPPSLPNNPPTRADDTSSATRQTYSVRWDPSGIDPRYDIHLSSGELLCTCQMRVEAEELAALLTAGDVQPSECPPGAEFGFRSDGTYARLSDDEIAQREWFEEMDRQDREDFLNDMHQDIDKDRKKSEQDRWNAATHQAIWKVFKPDRANERAPPGTVALWDKAGADLSRYSTWLDGPPREEKSSSDGLRWF